VVETNLLYVMLGRAMLTQLSLCSVQCLLWVVRRVSVKGGGREAESESGISALTSPSLRL